MDITEEKYKKLKEKADKWDALDKEIGKCYPDYDDDGKELPSEIPGADLVTIGEIAAMAFKYL